jgi:hypothetical protein
VIELLQLLTASDYKNGKHGTLKALKIDGKVEAKMEVNQAKTKVNLKEMREEIKHDQAEMRFTVSAIEEKMDAWIANVRDD